MNAPAIPDTSSRQPMGLGPILMIAPAILVSVFFFIIPMLTVALNSLTQPVGDGTTSFSIENYLVVVSDGFYWEVLARTVRIALISMLAALALGYPAALYLYFSESRWRRVFLFIVVSPLFISVIVRTYGWIVILSPNGAINAFLPDQFKLRILRTEAAIVIGLMHIYMPFMVLSINAALSRVDRKLLAAAGSLGASNLRMFRDILWPLSLPGVVSGCIIVFSIAMTAFSTPVLLGGSRNKTLPYLIYQQNLLLGDWHLGGALALVLLAVTIAVVVIATKLGNRDSNQTVLQQ